MLSGTELIFALLIVSVGALVLGTVSFGFGLSVTPVLLLFLDAKPTVVVVNCLTGLLLAMVLVQTWRHLNLRVSGGLIVGGLAATPVGVLALNSADPGTLKIIIAVVILILGLLSLANIRLPFAQRRLAGPAFGFVTSLAVTSISIGGPLAAIYAIAQRWDPQAVRASLALLFLTANGVAFALYSVTGLVDRDALANIGVLVPGLFVGFAVAVLVVGKLDERAFRYVAVVVILAGGSVLLGREIAGL